LFPIEVFPGRSRRKTMSKPEREVSREILDGIREIQRGDHGRVTVHISLDRDLYEQAKAEAGRGGISVAELIRSSLAEALESRREARPWMRYAGILDSGDPDSSSTVDEVVYGSEITEAMNQVIERLDEPGPEPFSSAAARRVLERNEE
jgi:post-segregation antitoxin (ccd killing protein)